MINVTSANRARENYRHIEMDFGPGEGLDYTLDFPAHVRLMDDANFEQYTRGEGYTYLGNRARVTTGLIRPPHPGHWHVVIDLDGGAVTVQVSVASLAA